MVKEADGTSIMPASGFSPVRRISNGLKRRLHQHVLDRKQEARFAVATDGLVETRDLALDGANAAHASRYEATPVWIFNRILARLPIDPAQFVFVDIGSGKGRILLLAAEAGFKQIEGVELATSLHADANRNIVAARAANPSMPPVLLFNGDATRCDIPKEPCLIYMFNPFGETVMEQMVERLIASLAAHPRPLYIIYLNAKHRHVFDNAGSFEEIQPGFASRMIEGILSPWPIAVYRASTDR